MTSGANATDSVAYLRYRSVSPAPQRVSTRMLNPTSQPKCCNPCANAALPACPKGSSAVVFISTPMRRIRSAFWARAASGHAAAATPAIPVMKSRRRIASLKCRARQHESGIQVDQIRNSRPAKRAEMVCLQSSNPEPRMPAVGHQRPKRSKPHGHVCPLCSRKRTNSRRLGYVRLVPLAGICGAANLHSSRSRRRRWRA